MESAYKEACELIASKELEKKWERQFKEVAKASKNSGYSFGDNITDMFNETFLRFN